MKKLKYLAIALVLVLSFSLVTVMPALAAPVVASVTETAFGTDTTNHYVDMPATVNAGDLLVVLFTNDGSATVTTPDGWSLLASNANGAAVRLSVYHKIAIGTEGGTTVNFVTSAAEQAAAQVYKITNWNGTTPPEISTTATGLSTRPNPASLDPAGWDVADTLWLAVAGQDRGDQSGTTAYPASYTDGTSTLSSSTTGNCRTHSARKVLAAASEDPGAFTIPVTEEWVAFTIAVRPAQRNLTTNSTTGGSVTTPGEATFNYDEGTVVDLIAEAEEGYRFVEWTGDVGNIADVHAVATTITMNDDYSITAKFIKQYDLITNSTAGGSVTEPGEEVLTYDEGTVVDLVATPEEGYRFVEWTGDVSTIADVHAATTTITMNGNYSITANFVAVYDLTMAADPAEGGTATDLTNESPYVEGTEVNIKAEAAEGYEFVGWTAPAGGFDDASAAETTFTMPAQNVTVTANFEEIPPPPVYPTVTTQAATNITTNSATLNMNYTMGDSSQVQVCFAYKKSTDSAWSYTAWVSKTADVTHAESLTELNFNTQYDFKAQLKYDDTVIEGTTLQFTTSTPSPSGSGCFIATAAYGTPTTKQIDVLREFRDVVLLKSTMGSQFVALYYQFSPLIADVIAGNELLRTVVRELVVDPIVWVVEATGDMWRN